MLSSLAYALGVLIRHLFLQATGWEPFIPLGFFVFIISWTFFGVLSFKKGLLSRLASLLMITSAIRLLTFNDQYNPYGAAVFGVLTLFTVLLSSHGQKNLPTKILLKGCIPARQAELVCLCDGIQFKTGSDLSRFQYSFEIKH